MLNNEKEVRKYEEEVRNEVFDNIRQTYLAQAEMMLYVKESCELLGLDADLPNIGITLNNKVIDFQHKFKRTGNSLYMQIDEKTGNVTKSFIGSALIERLSFFLEEGIDFLFGYEETCTEMLKEKRNELLEPKGVIKKLLLKNKRIQQNDEVTLTVEVREKLNEYLNLYAEKDSQLWNCKLEDELVPSIVKKIVTEDFDINQVSEILKDRVVPEMKKLGFESLIPKLKASIVEQYSRKVLENER